MASDYFENIGAIQGTFPTAAGERPQLPESARTSVPIRIANMPLSQVFYAGRLSVLHDSSTDEFMIDTYDIAETLPKTTADVLTNPALMQVAADVCGRAVTGYLIDYRRVVHQSTRDAGLEDGEDSDRFQEFRNKYQTAFPLGVVLNNAGTVEYHGHPEVYDSATAMTESVDAYLKDVGIETSFDDYFVPGIQEVTYAVASPRNIVALAGVQKAAAALLQAPFRIVPRGVGVLSRAMPAAFNSGVRIGQAVEGQLRQIPRNQSIYPQIVSISDYET
jgi:hypothetical protein